MQVAYDNVFKQLMGYEKFCNASDMLMENLTGNFDTHIRRHICGYSQRLNVSKNSLVNYVVNGFATIS